jgi:hypothetical protein
MDVVTLTAISLLTGLFVSLVVSILVILAGWPKPEAWTAGSFAIVAAAAWLHLVASWKRAHYPEPELLEPEHVRVDVLDRSEPGFLEGQYLDLPIDVERLVQIALSIERGAGFSLGLTGGAGPLSRSEFEALRDVFLIRGLARWKNERAHSQGIELSERGRSMMRVFAARASSQLPKVSKHEN